MCHRSARHAFRCILPPHVLRSIVEKGSPEQRELASRALGLDSTMRFMRATTAADVRPRSTENALALQEDGHKQRTIVDAGGKESTAGKVVRGEGDAPVEDVAANEAYDGLGATFDFFWEVFRRDSIDDQGLPMRGVVHFGKAYDNAFWDGSQMVFGDGDGKLFNRFTACVDVIGHELAHGVTEDEAALRYSGQPGALNESVSDVFGVLVKQYLLKQTADQADWLVGQGLFTPAVKGVALRSMKAPGTAFDDPVLGKDPQPAHMKNFVRTYDDNGGVHINSGIPNRAFYLAAERLGGHAWDKAGRIWYETLRDSRLSKTATFRAFAKLTVQVAGRLYGTGKAEAKAVAASWKDVGVATT